MKEILRKYHISDWEKSASSKRFFLFDWIKKGGLCVFFFESWASHYVIVSIFRFARSDREGFSIIITSTSHYNETWRCPWPNGIYSWAIYFFHVCIDLHQSRSQMIFIITPNARHTSTRSWNERERFFLFSVLKKLVENFANSIFQSVVPAIKDFN